MDKASKGPFWEVSRSAMGKCASIWNKAHRSTAGAEAMQDVANMRLSVPCVTRWNSEYKAISKLIGLRDDQLNDICGKLGVTKLHPHEVTFLREYVDVLQALSHSIDLLQGRKDATLDFSFQQS